MLNSLKVLDINLFQKIDQNAEFYCNTLRNHLKESHKHIERPHRHNFYMIMYITKGSGFHDIDFDSYPVQAGRIYFMSPGQVHGWQLSDNVDGYMVFFSQSFFDLHYADLQLKAFPFFGSVNFARSLQLNTGEVSKVIADFESIRNESLNNFLLRDHQIRNSILDILIYASRRFLENEIEEGAAISSSYIHTFQEFENLIEEHFLVEKSASFYAGLLHISGKHLNRISQSVVALKASEVIAKRIILEAQRMMVYMNEGLGDIAFILGFEEYPYFARFFKKHTGTSPSEFLALHHINLNR